MDVSKNKHKPEDPECDHYWTARANDRGYCDRCDTWTPSEKICRATGGHNWTTGAVNGEYCKVCGFHQRHPDQRWV